MKSEYPYIRINHTREMERRQKKKEKGATFPQHEFVYFLSSLQQHHWVNPSNARDNTLKKYIYKKRWYGL